MADFKLPVHITSAAGIIKNSSGEILLIRSERRGWEFPGGMIEQGEDIISGLKREIFEETGAEVSVGELFCVSSNTCVEPGYNGVDQVPPKTIFDFICSYKGGEFVPNEESLEMRFVKESDVLEMITAPVYRERFGAYLEYRGRPIYMRYEKYPEFRKYFQITI
jgi:8-oxo-dGTP pyrophosphatase MutT (NUDIX family)